MDTPHDENRPPPDWFDRLRVPDALRQHPVPKWRETLPERGSFLRQLGRLVWRAYRLSLSGRRRADLPGLGFDLSLVVIAAALGVAWLCQ